MLHNHTLAEHNFQPSQIPPIASNSFLTHRSHVHATTTTNSPPPCHHNHYLPKRHTPPLPLSLRFTSCEVIIQ
ncbi:hypothetical protein E2C01_069369 [Portunus trituberculatus]|uniref:Uncharacterized protein n=1 Tax=Portunus trituberculatus TaxID=210409 RepID=A0A5B7HZ66_PORTR|nr:hypothetical protein [Portunus trituberculatus]